MANTFLGFDVNSAIRKTGSLWNINFLNPYTRKDEDTKFYSRYEEPTYIGFKLEFGDWGASILENSNLKAQSEAVANFSNNSTSMDYDQFPCGLMDLHFVEKPEQTINFFETQSTQSKPEYNVYYNAVNYLYSMHQDQRANWLKAFVEGLYDLQRNYPHVFKKILGVDKLLEVNASRGQRVAKDTRITVECFDFLDQRVKTLFNMYRKAAWDEVYQRWVLPDIYRSFKLIIYLAEWRSFHKPFGRELLSKVAQKLLHTKNSNSNYGLQLDVFGDLDNEKYVENALPVFAFECSPCELIIPNSYTKGDFEAGGNTAEEFKFDVLVKNVKTFQRNILMKKLNTVIVGDLLSSTSASNGINAIDASSGVLQNASLEQMRYMWLKHFYFTNDYQDKTSSHYSKHNYNLTNSEKSQLKAANFIDAHYDGKDVPANKIDYSQNTKYLISGLHRSSILLRAIGRSNSFVRLLTDMFYKITGIDKIAIIDRTSYARDARKIKESIRRNFDPITIIDNTNQEISLNPKDGLINVSPNIENEFIKQVLDVSIIDNFSNDNSYKQLLDSIKYLKEHNDEVKKNMLKYINDLKQNLINNKAYLDEIKREIGNDRSYATDLDGGPLHSKEEMQSIVDNTSIAKQELFKPDYDVSLNLNKEMQHLADLSVNISKDMTPLKSNFKINKSHGMSAVIDNVSINNDAEMQQLQDNFKIYPQDMQPLVDNIELNTNESMPTLVDNSSIAQQEFQHLIDNVSNNNSTEMVSISQTIPTSSIETMTPLVDNVFISRAKNMSGLIDSTSTTNSSGMHSVVDNVSIRESKNMIEVNSKNVSSTASKQMSKVIDNIELDNNLKTSSNEYSNVKPSQMLHASKESMQKVSQDSIATLNSIEQTQMTSIEDNVKLNKDVVYSKIENNATTPTSEKMVEVVDNIHVESKKPDVHIINNVSTNKSKMQVADYQLDLPTYKIPSLQTDISTLSFTQMTAMTDDLEKANMQLVGIINDQLDKNPQVKMQKLDQGDDRSLATDLDGGPQTKRSQMTHIEQPKHFSTATQGRELEV